MSSGYRLALRTAFFIADEIGALKTEVFAHMKRAYARRSGVVHGSELRTLRLADGSEVGLDEFVQGTRNHLRAALRKAVRAASGRHWQGANWDDLILYGSQDAGG